MFLFTLLFLGRVLAQGVEYFVDIPFIPDFEQWHSATLPYWLLLLFQLLILGFMGTVTARLFQGTLRLSRQGRKCVLRLGWIYFWAMAARHLLGLTLLADTVWFTSTLSILFHYVLALFLIVLGNTQPEADKE